MADFHEAIPEDVKNGILQSMNIVGVLPVRPMARSFEAEITCHGDRYEFRVRQDIVNWATGINRRAGSSVATLLSLLTSFPTALMSSLGWCAEEYSTAMVELRSTLRNSGVIPKDCYEEDVDSDFPNGVSLPEGMRGRSVGGDGGLAN